MIRTEPRSHGRLLTSCPALSAMRIVGIWFLLCVVVLALNRASAVSPPAARKPAVNVILITIDTVRADHLGCYGAKDIKTPTLDGLARDGIVFERAISQVPLTWPSHAAILTGLYPFQNGVQDFTGQPLDVHFRSVAQTFKERGYATGAVVSAFVLDRSWGLARGFDFYDDAFAPEAFVNRDLGLVDRRAGESVDRATAWLTKNSRRPFFFWLHLYDPHSPYDPPEPYRTQYRAHPYDGEIAYADHELGRLIIWLKRNRLYNRSLILFLSDHGESLGDHGEHEHGFFVYNSTVHIPLIVKPPAGSGFRPGRISRPVETVAVAPTLVQMAKLQGAVEKQFQSNGLLSTDARTEDQAYSETFYPFSSFGWNPLHALESSRYHYIDAPEPELYDLVADPEEKNNLAGEQPAIVAVLKDKLKMLLQSHPFTPTGPPNTSSELSPDALEKLRALGYVGFRAAVLPESLKAGLADPKDKLWEFNTILKAEDALQRNDDNQADTLLRQVQEQDPNIYVIPFLLGESELRHQNWETAADQLQRSLKLNPNFDSAMTGMARALSKLDRLEEAKSWLQKALQNNSQNYRAWYEAGLLDASSNPEAALADYQKATAIQPSFFPGQRELGLALFNQKDYPDAAAHLEKALALGLEDAHIHNFLGICYSQMHQLSRAVREHRRAIELEPKLSEAHLNLAYDYQLQHQATKAQEEYKQACKLEERFCKFGSAQ